MERKMLGVAITLLIGVALGFPSGYFMAPSIEPLQRRIDELQDQITQSEDQIQRLRDQVNNLTNQLALGNNQISELRNELTQKNDQIQRSQNELSQKDDQIQRLQEQVSDLITQMTNLNQRYQALLSDYEKLLNDYRMLNAPASTFVSASDLDFTIATRQHIYSYKDPISGNVTIYYHNGTAFKGKFSIYIECISKGVTSGFIFNVNGYGQFYVKSPAFGWGPGFYRIGFHWLYDSEGYTVATPNEIGHIYVTVEAK